MNAKGKEMLDLAIVGGGVCGLVLANAARKQGLSFALFEARDRLGGRVLTVRAGNGLDIDLGPGWYWPETQPAITALIAELGLANFAQHDSGPVAVLADPDKSPQMLQDSVHQGARRLKGGMAALTGALAASLPADAPRLNHILTAVRDRGDHVDLHFRNGETHSIIPARRVALAVPPRLLNEHVAFAPALPDAVRAEMRGCYTWMAGQAKAVIAYDRAPWREKGLSGNGFVSHEQAVFGEVFDCCDETGALAGLGGFLAMPAELRARFRAGLPMLMGNQMAQLFGPEVEHGAQYYQDWANEPLTCATLDRNPPAGHPDYQNAALRHVFWDGRLYLGGAETAVQNVGYLDGAVQAAERIAQSLSKWQPSVAVAVPLTINDASLARFGHWVETQRRGVFEQYRQRLNRGLAAQQKEQITQRAMLETMEQVFADALAYLDTLPFDPADVTVEQGRSSLTPLVQAAFQDFIQSLLDDVTVFNRTSCALSNFPDEHRPPKDYIQAILLDIAAAWREFSLAANDILRTKLPQCEQAAS